MIILMSAAVADEYVLIPKDRNEQDAEFCVHDCGTDKGKGFLEALKFSNEMPLIDIDILPP